VGSNNRADIESVPWDFAMIEGLKMGSGKIRIGIIGGGWVATARHIPSFLRDPRCAVVGLADYNRERGLATAQRFSIPNVVPSLAELLNVGVDAVSICTPPWTHAELSLQALEAGVHVLTEKPMAVTVSDARAMVQAAEARGLKLSVVHNFLFSRSATRAARLMARAPDEAPVHAAAVQLSSGRRRLPPWYPKLPGGLFFDEAPHMVYMLQRFMGELELTYATATRGSAKSGQPYRGIHVGFQSASGTASLLMVFDSPVSEWLIAAIRRLDLMVLDLFRDTFTLVGPDGRHKPFDVLKTSLGCVLQHIAEVTASGSRFIAGRLLYGHDVLIRGFIDSIVQGTPPPVTGHDGLAVVEMLWKILDACGLNRREM